MSDFDPQRILEVLERHRVRYVVIGGLAATIHGSPYVTSDVDIVPATDRDNLQRLSDALTELDAQVRAPDGPSPFANDAESLGRVQILNLTTTAGDLDPTFVPAGTAGYADVARDAEVLEILGVEVWIASLADVIRSKEAADREKDRLHLPLLRQLLTEQ